MKALLTVLSFFYLAGLRCQPTLFADIFPDSSESQLEKYSVVDEFLYNFNQFNGANYNGADTVTTRFDLTTFKQFFIYENTLTGKKGLIVQMTNGFATTPVFADSIEFGRPDSYTNFDYFFQENVLATNCLNFIFYTNGSSQLWQVQSESNTCEINYVGEIKSGEFYIPMYSYEYDEDGHIDHISGEFHEINTGQVLKNEVLDRTIVNFETGPLVSNQNEQGDIEILFTVYIAPEPPGDMEFRPLVKIWYCVDSNGIFHVADYALQYRF